MKSVDCPFCDGKAELLIEEKTRTFRKEDFQVFEYCYKCNKCKEEFTNTEIDSVNVSQVYNKYREKYSIPFPEQLTSLREHYNLSAAKISELLGFGANQYRLYEGGEIPAGGNATVLSLIINPASFKEILLKNKTLLPDKKFSELIHKADENISDSLSKWVEHSLFPKDVIPDRYMGFTVPQFNKFANMVLFFIANAPFKVRLNKLLFYADFVNYKYTGFSMSGCRYAAIPMGSVPDQYSYIFSLMETEGVLTTELVKVRNEEHEKFVPLKKFEKNLFNESELNTLGNVLKRFKNVTTQELMKISHEEKAWLSNIDKKEIIDYSVYAPQIIAL